MVFIPDVFFTVIDIASPSFQPEMLDLNMSRPLILGTKDGVATISGKDARIRANVFFARVFAEFVGGVEGRMADRTLVLRP